MQHTKEPARNKREAASGSCDAYHSDGDDVLRNN